MTATTLAIVNAPTLMDGLVELLRIGDALAATDNLAGVAIYRDTQSGRMLDAEPDYEVPAGMLVTTFVDPLGDPWLSDGHPSGLPIQDPDLAARRELLELLAHVTHGDIIATAEGVTLL